MLEEKGQHEHYQVNTGSPMYLAQRTRYDIVYSVVQLARATKQPVEGSLEGCKKLELFERAAGYGFLRRKLEGGTRTIFDLSKKHVYAGQKTD